MASLVVHGRLRRLVAGPTKGGHARATAKGHWSVVELLLHARGNLAANRRRGIRHETQQEESEKRRQIQTKNGRNEASEQVEVGVRNGIDGLQGRHSLSLGEPTQENTSSDDNVVLCNARETGQACEKKYPVLPILPIPNSSRR
jgi:hypothetical protein